MEDAEISMQAEHNSHPNLHKLARALIAIACRQLDEEEESSHAATGEDQP